MASIGASVDTVGGLPVNAAGSTSIP
eukprot:COSAG01_NODE_66439_length_270_cov_0.602339_2_plen_25_part_01